MEKKLLVLLMLLGVAFGAMSQTEEQIEQAILRRDSAFYKDIQVAFDVHSARKGPNWKEATGKQFIVDDVSKYNITAKGIVKQFDEMENASGKKFEVEIKTSNRNCDINNYTTSRDVKVITTGKGKYVGKNSVVKCRVNIKWEIDNTFWDKKNGKWKKDAFIQKNKRSAVNIVSISFEELCLFPTEKRNIANEINKKINEWYSKLDKSVIENSKINYSPKVKEKLTVQDCGIIDVSKGVDAKVVTENTLGVQKPCEQRFEITVSNAPSFVVNSVDAWKYVPQGKELEYTDPKASWIVQPVFVLKVEDPDKTVPQVFLLPEVKLTVVDYKGPETDREKEARLKAAKNKVEDFARKLKQYAHDRKDKSAALLKNDREEMEKMFVDKSANIQFTLISKDGKEDLRHVKTPTTPRKYLLSTEEIIVPVTQQYTQLKGREYADRTKKEFYLKWDAKEGWLIEKIVTGANKTELQ